VQHLYTIRIEFLTAFSCLKATLSGDEDHSYPLADRIGILQFTATCVINPTPLCAGPVEDETMAQRCDICGKGPMTGSNISHAHNVTKRRWIPNIQRVRAMVDGRPTYIKVCTRCLRSGKVVKAPRV
jgi:large subunit ribosomal protein L28